MNNLNILVVFGIISHRWRTSRNHLGTQHAVAVDGNSIHPRDLVRNSIGVWSRFPPVVEVATLFQTALRCGEEI